MITDTNGNAGGKEGKPLQGIGLVVAQEQSDGSRKTLGVVFAPNVEKLKELVKTLHGAKVTVSLSDVRGGTLTLNRA